ncbi:N-acetylglucosaminyl-phosphatidylinositol de-N-acetylase [Phytophthora pseudosyringae]|uniref:N-acetylglucosaminyl-phosphatidylinositol de-N-acetylase n=1 Tax=Phytophthora pseudosyringae TaxID=221518 RepID=A0A8T1W5H5_9STRA|nr:N-acetylglucosaminyl-phosphatidylinositol de-N-acetylase [Phytophthora pseudosyringae]
MLLDLGEDELQTLLEMFKYLLLGTNVLLFLTAALVFFTSSAKENIASSSALGQFKRALVVTAHPDDESMFFLPLVHSLQQQPEGSKDMWQTHLLCLSRGNFDGLGGVREKELKACATYIGLSTDHVQVLEDPKLQDGMKAQWDAAHIAAIVTEYMEKNNIDAVFTFDDYGVSGHANHVATHYGVKRAIREQQEKCSATTEADDSSKETKVVRGWALDSTNILRKYTGLLDTALSFWLTRRKDAEQEESQFVFVFRPRWNYNAMALHQSQFVWYRRLFVAFSRYTFINTFRPILSVGTADLPAEQKKMQ